MNWEYDIDTVDFFDFQDEDKRLGYLNEKGLQGWELIKMEEEDEVFYKFWFKRKID